MLLRSFLRGGVSQQNKEDEDDNVMVVVLALHRQSYHDDLGGVAGFSHMNYRPRKQVSLQSDAKQE